MEVLRPLPGLISNTFIYGLFPPSFFIYKSWCKYFFKASIYQFYDYWFKHSTQQNYLEREPYGRKETIPIS